MESPSARSVGDLAGPVVARPWVSMRHSPTPGRWPSECRSACHFSTVTSHDRHRDRDHRRPGSRPAAGATSRTCRAGHPRGGRRLGNQMWRLGDELAVRMQRMDPTPELQLKERRWLPVLAPLLPLPVRFAEPSERFPKHWTVMSWVPGEPLDHGLIGRGAHAADTLAGFLQALRVEAPAEAPIAANRGAHPRNCTDGFESFFQAALPPTTSPSTFGPSGTTPLRPRRGEARRCGCTATSIPRTSSSRTERSRASSTSLKCSSAIQPGTLPPHGCCYPRARPQGSSTCTRLHRDQSIKVD